LIPRRPCIIAADAPEAGIARRAVRRDRDRRRGSAPDVSGWGTKGAAFDGASAMDRWRAKADDGGGDGVDSEAVFERVKGIVSERLGVEDDKVTMEAEFINDLNADSLDLVGVISDIEDAFNLTIADSDMESIRTVGDAVGIIEERSS
jgi:acyl carrier protein